MNRNQEEYDVVIMNVEDIRNRVKNSTNSELVFNAEKFADEIDKTNKKYNFAFGTKIAFGALTLVGTGLIFGGTTPILKLIGAGTTIVALIGSSIASKFMEIHGKNLQAMGEVTEIILDELLDRVTEEENVDSEIFPDIYEKPKLSEKTIKDRKEIVSLLEQYEVL